MGTLGVVRALLARDIRMAVSYRAGFALSFISTLGGIAGVFFLNEAVGAGAAPVLEEYGGNYFGFAIIGVAVTSFMTIGISSIAGRIREGLMMGTLEFMLLSPNRLPVILFGSAVWSHAYGFVTMALYVVIAIVLGVRLEEPNVPLALVAFVLAVLSFNALGLLAAAVVILTKQGDPVTLLISSASLLLAGVLYPPSVLPEWLQALGQLLPLTHALEVMRLALLQGEGLDTLWPSLAALTVLSAAYLAIGLAACEAAVRVARRDGSLSYY